MGLELNKNIYTVIIILFLSVVNVFAQKDECLVCHSDKTLTLERNGKTLSLFVDEEHFNSSMHGEQESH